MKYNYSDLEDLLGQARFREWVARPTPAEDAYWQHWQHADPERPLLLATARVLVRAMSPTGDAVPPEAVQAAWHKLNQQRTAAPRRLWPGGPALRVAAAAVLLLAGAVALWLQARQPAPTVYATRSGETRRITLPDGSVVVLNAGSRLTVPARWTAGRDRTVWLSGEAYFTVRKTARRSRFTVHAADLRIEVLGTQFNVKQTPRRTDVVLSEGSVKVDAPRQPDVLLAPGEALAYEARTHRLQRKRVNPDHYKAWLDRKIEFRGTPLREVAQVIETLYDCRVEIRDSATAARTLTAILPVSDKPDALLDGLETVFGLSIDRKPGLIVIDHAR